MAQTTITREDAKGLLSPKESSEIIQSVVEKSVVMSMGTRLRDMTAGEREYPIMESYPLAGFVDGDTGLKPTTGMKWAKKKITAGEIAAILPVPDAVAADSNYDIFAQMRPRLEEAAARVLDTAVFFGDSGKPTAWRDDIVTSAKAAGNSVTATTDAKVYDDIFGADGIIAKVEEDGYFPTGITSAISMRAKLRGLKDTTGRPLFMENLQSSVPYTLGGMQMQFPRNGSFDAEKALMIVGDFSSLVYAIRQDITFDVFDSGVVSDSSGKVLYNLMQQDMKAIRMVIRIGWEIFNPINAVNGTENTRFPFAVYLPAGE